MRLKDAELSLLSRVGGKFFVRRVRRRKLCTGQQISCSGLARFVCELRVTFTAKGLNTKRLLWEYPLLDCYLNFPLKVIDLYLISLVLSNLRIFMAITL
jgi:hypothetical protein